MVTKSPDRADPHSIPPGPKLNGGPGGGEINPLNLPMLPFLNFLLKFVKYHFLFATFHFLLVFRGGGGLKNIEFVKNFKN